MMKLSFRDFESNLLSICIQTHPDKSMGTKSLDAEWFECQPYLDIDDPATRITTAGHSAGIVDINRLVDGARYTRPREQAHGKMNPAQLVRQTIRKSRRAPHMRPTFLLAWTTSRILSTICTFHDAA